jgi:anti-sigma factor RsiW
MKCRDSWVKEHLAGFASGGLKQEAAGRVAAHLESCSECSLELEILRDLISLEVPDPGEEFWAELSQRTMAEVKTSRARTINDKAVRPRIVTFSHRWAWGGGVAAACAAALILLFLRPFGGAVDNAGNGSLLPYTSGHGQMVSLGTETELLSEGPMEVALLERALEVDDEIPEKDRIILEEGSVLEGLRIEDLDDETLRILEKILDEMMPNGVERG